jgi:hypothetical protein
MFPNNIASIVSLMAVSLPLGGTVGHTVMSTVFNNLAAVGSAHDLFDSLGDIASLPPESLAAFAHKVKMAVVWAYVALVPFMLIVGVFRLFPSQFVTAGVC